jgi:hypothetical protein
MDFHKPLQRGMPMADLLQPGDVVVIYPAVMRERDGENMGLFGTVVAVNQLGVRFRQQRDEQDVIVPWGAIDLIQLQPDGMSTADFLEAYTQRVVQYLGWRRSREGQAHV